MDTESETGKIPYGEDLSSRSLPKRIGSRFRVQSSMVAPDWHFS